MINFLKVPFHFYFFPIMNILSFFLLKWHMLSKSWRRKMRERKVKPFFALRGRRKNANFLLFSGYLEAFLKAACRGSTFLFKLLKILRWGTEKEDSKRIFQPAIFCLHLNFELCIYNFYITKGFFCWFQLFPF